VFVDYYFFGLCQGFYVCVLHMCPRLRCIYDEEASLGAFEGTG